MAFKKLFLSLFLCLPLLSPAQEEEDRYKIPDTVPFTIDSLYREDQFYAGFHFNLITNRPSNVSQESFSGGLNLGFIRDFPLNKRRNIALGAGLGWSINTYGQNLFIGKNEDGSTIFESLDNEVNYSTNRFTTQLVEAPIEFRWRTSSPETYKFWRVYGGVRLGYIYHFRSRYKDADREIIVNDLKELDRFRLGATFTFGYNTFNFQFYYALNPFFKDAKVDDANLDLSTLKIGLTFYIL
ncbi:porin family protein [Christiangramia echinicola]|uniref:Outer membrane protein beta-barrel domain-containing protein n=1 Tax=Christiangramia echinicola TaxID=279359 RepID=A0A1H1M074_9FLAO|nr:porin family protein [Christiangramia echinicola]SDR79715.1 Outer membrane protein beta-barrel domain-containing protein [Christiangramia echinicola]